MSTIYITGHRNPDMDSLCAASAYAKLKNMTDPSNEYVAVHCSPVSDSVKKQMKVMDLPIPPYRKDVYPKVRDVMLAPTEQIQASAPIYDLVKTYSLSKPSVVPVYEGKTFKGLLSIDDITSWFLTDNNADVPVYRILTENVLRVIPGEIVHKGRKKELVGSLIVGAASLEDFTRFLDAYKKCIVVMGARDEHIAYAIKKQVAAIIITAAKEKPDIDFSGYKGTVFVTPLGTAETIRRVRMAESVGPLMQFPTETIDADTLFRDGRSIFTNSPRRGFAVTDNGKFVGFVTRRCFLNEPTKSVIMVDHNEPAQSIRGIETANVVEILDHHRLDSLTTTVPIYIASEPLGSTCTIVYQQYIRHGIMPDPDTARTLLAGIIADTLILRSPTTTAADISTAEMLARLAKENSIGEFGERMFSITDNLAIQDPEKMILSDFKKYASGGVHFGIGQCEVTTLGNVSDYADAYLEALANIRSHDGLDWALLMITDVLREKSVLLATDHASNRELPYRRTKKGIYSMPGVMSRKKQLLPTLLSITTR